MEHEHVCFDSHLARLDESLRSGDTEMARVHLATFDLQLTGYVRGEERVVFPMLERKTTNPCSSTARMRAEHESLHVLVMAIWRALDRAEQHRGLHLLEALRSVLALHFAKEDWVLYPLLDQTPRHA